MNWRILFTRLGGLGLVGATTTGAALSFKEDIPEEVEDIRWDFLVRRSDQEMKKKEELQWKHRPIERTNNKGTIEIGREIWVEDDKEEVVWKCGIRGALVGEPKGQSRVKEQFDTLLSRIKEDEASRNRFIDNCALNRLDEEREEGGVSEIELEMVSKGESYEIKDLEKVYGEDNVLGHKRLNENEKRVLMEKGNDITIGSNKVGVLNLYHLGRIFCIIHGDKEEKGNLVYEDNSFKNHLNNLGGERRRYIFKNCLKYSRKGNIYGLKVVKTAKSWKFKDMNSITGRIYSIQD